MKLQWSILLSLLFALLIAVFAVVNVDSVPVNYIVGQAEMPLILVILSSALFGGLAVGIFGMVRQFRLSRKIRQLEKSLAAKDVPDASLSPQDRESEALTGNTQSGLQ